MTRLCVMAAYVIHVLFHCKIYIFMNCIYPTQHNAIYERIYVINFVLWVVYIYGSAHNVE